MQSLVGEWVGMMIMTCVWLMVVNTDGISSGFDVAGVCEACNQCCTTGGTFLRVVNWGAFLVVRKTK